MYLNQKRKKFPSQERYEQNNPTITFRMKKHEKEKIKNMADRSGKSISELVRIALLNIERDFTAAYAEAENRSYQKAIQDWALWSFCNICGQAIYIPPNSDTHKAIIEFLKEHGWGHPECHEK